MKAQDIARLPRLAALELKPAIADAYGIARKQPVFLLTMTENSGYKTPWVHGLAGAPGIFKPSDFARYLGYQGEAISQ